MKEMKDKNEIAAKEECLLKNGKAHCTRSMAEINEP